MFWIMFSSLCTYSEKLEENYMIEYVSGTVNEISEMNEVFPEFGFCIPCKEEVRF